MTTVEKIALQEFNIKYKHLGDNEKQWCHDEMVNNPKWLAPFWKQPGYKTEAEIIIENKVKQINKQT